LPEPYGLDASPTLLKEFVKIVEINGNRGSLTQFLNSIDGRDSIFPISEVVHLQEPTTIVVPRKSGTAIRSFS
jgi:hypothetical protein